MNGIEKITKEIASEAEAEITSVLTEAEARASAVAEEYAARAKAAEEELMRAGRDSAEQRVQREERTARLEARKEILGLKQALVSEAYDKAKETILGLDEDQYVAFLAKQACAAALTQRGLPGELKLSDETKPVSGGLVLRRGSIEVNCTLDKLLEMSRGTLDAEVASVLFG